MIITYNRWENTYANCLFIPDTVPWKLFVEIEHVSDGSEPEMEEFPTTCSLKILTGTGMEERILTSKEFFGRLPEGADEEEEIREFFNYVALEAATDLAFYFEDGKRVFDLSGTIERCTEDWMLQLQSYSKKE